MLGINFVLKVIMSLRVTKRDARQIVVVSIVLASTYSTYSYKIA